MSDHPDGDLETRVARHIEVSKQLSQLILTDKVPALVEAGLVPAICYRLGMLARLEQTVEVLERATRDAAELIEGIDSWKDWHTEEARDALLAWLARPEVVKAREK